MSQIVAHLLRHGVVSSQRFDQQLRSPCSAASVLTP